MDFTEWVKQEMDAREMGNNEFARRGKIASSTVSNVLNGKMKVSYKFCKGVAKAFGIPLEYILKKAGLLPPDPGDTNGDMTLKEVWDILQTMDHSQLREARRYLLYLARNDRTPAPETVTR